MNKLLIATSIAFVLSQNIFAKEAPVENEQTRFESLSKLTKVIGTVEKYYVDDIKLQEIVDKALKGLMQELDAHSSYLDKKASKEMSIATSGEFGGLGITVGMRDGALTVISPIDDTPAFKAGVKSGDIILKINETSTIGITLDEAVNMMRGEPKSDIKLTIVRKGDNKPLEIAMKRDIIKVQSVFAKKIEGENLLYLRISSFDTKVTNDLEKAIKENKDVKGIVLDLRNNPGGLLNQAIGVVDRSRRRAGCARNGDDRFCHPVFGLLGIRRLFVGPLLETSDHRRLQSRRDCHRVNRVRPLLERHALGAFLRGFVCRLVGGPILDGDPQRPLWPTQVWDFTRVFASRRFAPGERLGANDHIFGDHSGVLSSRRADQPI
jgi:hypothetical protein